MAKNALDSVLRYLRRIAVSGDDARLLEQFACHGDEGAFERLVVLHGPMVLGLCRRLLRHEQDAEDAFQATFLTLARKAATIKKQESLPSWLYKVAYRAACQARRRDLTNRMSVLSRVAAKTESDAAELHGVLDEEIAGLAEVYRRPIVLCYLQGKTHEEAARLLGWPRGTVATRLARAKEQLRHRLTRRGWRFSAAAIALALGDKALAATLPVGLVKATAACLSETGGASPKVVALTEGVLRMLWFNKLKMVAGVLLAVVVAGTGVGLVLLQTWAEAAQAEQGQETRKQAQVAAQKSSGQSALAEVAELRKQVDLLDRKLDAALKEIKRLNEVLAPTKIPSEGEPIFRGKPLAYWLNQHRDGDPKIRAEAVLALGYFARRHKQLIPVLVADLNPEEDPLGFVQPAVIEAFRLAGKDVAPALGEVVNDNSSPSRQNAMAALKRMGPEAKSVIPALIHAFEQSIAVTKAKMEKKPSWKTDIVGDEVQFLVNSFPNRILDTLMQLDPEIRRALPADNASNWEEIVSQWQKLYETLKKHYGIK
jgi:RNA polymerase sigma factor (sigma-70 family)